VNKLEEKYTSDFENCMAVAAILFITLIENLRLCSSEAGIIFNLFLNFEQKYTLGSLVLSLFQN